jgi:hypothetical protein
VIADVQKAFQQGRSERKVEAYLFAVRRDLERRENAAERPFFNIR